MTEEQAVKVAALVARGYKKRDALREVGLSVANQDRLFKRKKMQRAMASINDQVEKSCEKHRLTVDRLVKKVSQGLDAKRPASAILISADADSADKKTYDLVDDHDAQVKWWDRAAELKKMKIGLGEALQEGIRTFLIRAEDNK